MMLPAEGPPPETAFAVDFNAYVAGNYNRDLGGKGRLLVRAEEPRFVFTGRPRGTFSIAKTAVEFALRSDQIWNVTQHDAGVEFATSAGKCGAKRTPFVFTCASADEARAVVALLPAAKDAEFIQNEHFLERLRAMPDAGRGLGSPTNLLVLVNVAVFVVFGLLGAGWFEVADMRLYMKWGANNAAATTDGEWWRLVTCMFLHYGVVHLLLNAWALFQAGHLVEKLFGRPRFALLYFGSGIIGSLATLRWNGDKVWSAGASGAVFGVYGALLGYLWREKHGVPAGVFKPMLKSTLIFAGYNLVFGAAHPHIDNAAHVGGLLGGLLIGWCAALPIEPAARERLRRRRTATAAAVTLAVAAAGIAAAPRYDYRVRDELAWEDAFRTHARAESAITRAQRTALAAYAEQGDALALVRWVEDAGLPFYEDWRRRIDAVALTPGRATARYREAFTRVLQMKIESYRRLIADIRRQDPEAVDTFLAAEARLQEEAATLRRD